MAKNIQSCIERILQAVERHEWQSQHRGAMPQELSSLRSVLREAKQLAHAVQFDDDYRTICRMGRGVYVRYHDAQWDLDHANSLWEIAQNADRTPVERLNALLDAYAHASQAGYYASQMCSTMGDVEHDASSLMIKVEAAVQAISNVEQTAEEVERDDQFNAAVKAVRDSFVSTGGHLRLVTDDK